MNAKQMVGRIFFKRKGLYVNPVCLCAMRVRRPMQIISSMMIQIMMAFAGSPIFIHIYPKGSDRKCMEPTMICKFRIFPTLSMAICNPMVSWLMNTIMRNARQNMMHSAVGDWCNHILSMKSISI